MLLRNVNADHHHWIGLKLVGGPKSPRDAIGAAVYLTSGGVRQRRDVISGGSFASSNDPRLHFGLGASNDVEKVEIHWSDGNIQNAVISAGVDRYYTIAEGGRRSYKLPKFHRLKRSRSSTLITLRSRPCTCQD